MEPATATEQESGTGSHLTTVAFERITSDTLPEFPFSLINKVSIWAITRKFECLRHTFAELQHQNCKMGEPVESFIPLALGRNGSQSVARMSLRGFAFGVSALLKLRCKTRSQVLWQIAHFKQYPDSSLREFSAPTIDISLAPTHLSPTLPLLISVVVVGTAK